MRTRTEWRNRKMELNWKRFATDAVTVKRYAGKTGSGFEQFRQSAYTLETVSHCAVVIAQTVYRSAIGQEIAADAKITYLGNLEFAELDLVNIGGTVTDGVLTGGDDFRILKVEQPDRLQQIYLERV